MSFNLIDSVKSIFGSDFVSRASTVTGESENNLKTAIGGIVPSVLTGLLNQAGTGNPKDILSMAHDASQSGILGNLSGILGNAGFLAKGNELLKSLFGERAGSVNSLISGFSGIRESSAASLMSIAAPAALGILGKHATETNMGSGNLLSFLNTQKDSILAAIPSGLNLAGALGLGSLSGIGSKLSGKLNEVKSVVGTGAEKLAHMVPNSKKVNWLPLVLGAVVVIAVIIFISKGCNGADSRRSEMAATDTVKSDQVVKAPVTSERESMKVKLPDGTELNAFKGGIEDQLVVFLENPSSIPGKDVWFDFDNLNFNTGSAQITTSSATQISNIAAILKTFPKARVKIGGYTDKTGDSTGNLKLSQARADAVFAALNSSGAGLGQIIGAEGYGSQFAKAAATATEEERQPDRRISLSVRAK